MSRGTAEAEHYALVEDEVRILHDLHRIAEANNNHQLAHPSFEASSSSIRASFSAPETW